MSTTLHFVGFSDDELLSALHVWGKPDFWHRLNDEWARAEFMLGNVVVFARGSVRTFHA